MADHIAAELDLALVVGRRVDRNDDVGAHPDHLVGRIALVQTLFPKRLVVPEVLANDDAEFDAVNLKYPAMVRRLEITRVVENVVFGQERLVGKPQQPPVVNDRGGIIKPAAVLFVIGPDRADDRRDTAGRRDNALERVEGRADDIGVLKPVLRRIAMRHDLGENDEVRTVIAGLFDRRDHLGRIAGDVAVSRIYLSNGDFH